MDTKPVSGKSVGDSYGVDGSQLSRHYKNTLSGYSTWEQKEHAYQWVLYPDNMGDRLCLDEVSISNGELYTVLTNGTKRCQKGSLIAMIKGVKSSNVINVLKKLPLEKRHMVKEISVDMAKNMEKIATSSFPLAQVVTDRFHVAKLVSEAVQQVRIDCRWKAIKKEAKEIKKAQKKGEKYVPFTYENGDTPKQLLARSRYLLFKPKSKWTEKQQQRAKILFKHYPKIRRAYYLSMMLRSIYEICSTKEQALEQYKNWNKKIKKSKISYFHTVANSLEAHQENILNFFDNRTTNALAENFNSKIKSFRAIFRGVRDPKFFIYRLGMILA